MRPAEAEAVLVRDAARYFLGGNGARVTAVHPAKEVGTPSFAAAGPAGLVESIRAGASAAGLKPVAIVPAQTAWVAAAEARGLGTAGRRRVVIAAEGDTAHVMRLEKGSVRSLRRIPLHREEELVSALGEGPGDVVVFAEERVRQRLLALSREAGWSSRRSEGSAGSAAEEAALHADKSSLELVPPLLAAERRERARIQSWRMAVAALALLLLSAAVVLWGAKREVDAIVAQREAIRDEVAPLLAVQDSLVGMEERIKAVRGLEATAPRLTTALVDIARLLPSDTHLTSFHADGDRLVFEAAGGRAGSAIQALRQSETLTDVRLLGMVERELEEGSTILERYQLTALLVREVDDGEVRAAAGSAEGSSPPGGRSR